MTLIRTCLRLNIGVQGIWREICCFILPDNPQSKVPQEASVLLGLPWLFSVDAKISIRNASIAVGDPLQGEEPVKVTGPKLVMQKSHYHAPESLKKAQLTEESSEEEGEDYNEEESDESSDDQGLGALRPDF